MLFFVIVGKHDRPLFETELSKGSGDRNDIQLCNFVLHSSLDVVDDIVWKSNNQYLRQVDKYNNYNVSAYVTCGNVRLLLLHSSPLLDEQIKLFFQDVYELYLKILLNPFYQPNSEITSKAFYERVHQAAKRLLDTK